jgi:hypothetical protein
MAGDVALLSVASVTGRAPSDRMPPSLRARTTDFRTRDEPGSSGIGSFATGDL